MNIKPTAEDQERGYNVCDCGSVHLLQAGYEVPLHCCSLCGQWIADSDVFFRVKEGVGILSK